MPRVPKVPPASPNAAPKGKKSVAPGYKNYGQQRSSEVHDRNAARRQYKRERKMAAGMSPDPAPKVRYGRKELTDSGVRDRTISRFNRLKARGITVPGLSQADLDTGAGARKVKRALRRARDSKTKYSI